MRGYLEVGPRYGKWLSLLAAWMAMLMSGATFSFNLYTNAIKETFNVTQTEVTYMLSMLTTGLDNGVLPALLSRVTGTRGMSVAALLLTPTGYFLTWLAFNYRNFHNRNSGLLVLYFAMSGFGTSFVFLASLTAAVNNFPSQHRGKAVGLTEGTLSGLSPAFMAVLYSFVFSNGEYDNPIRQNCKGFILFLAVGSLIAFGFCCFFLSVYPDEAIEEKKLFASDHVNSYSDLKQDDDKIDDVTSPTKCVLFPRFCRETFAYIFTIDMQCLMWSFALIAGVSAIYFNNNSVILRSEGHSSYQPLLTIMQPVVAMVSACVASVTSDFFIDRCPRVMHVLAFSVILGITQLVLVFLSSHVGVLIYASVVSGMTTGYVWNLMVTIVSEIMGVKNFARNWGTVTLCYGITNIFMQYMFGAIYDLNSDTDRTCKGIICFQWTFGICTFLSFITTAIFIAIWVRHRTR